MKNGKVCDSSAIYAKMLKWLAQEGLAYVKDILNQAYRYGFHPNWQDNQLSNYQTSMLRAIMAKLFGSLFEGQLNTWAEKNTKRAKGQAGF